jgi:hypothetical protein
VSQVKANEAEHGPVTVTSAAAAEAEASGVVDPHASIPGPPTAPPTTATGSIPQAQYGSGEG